MRLSKLKFALRSLYRQKLYTMLNLAGLAIGFTVAILVSMYLYSEFTYDEHHPAYREIYRANSHYSINEKQESSGGSGFGLAALMSQHFPQIEEATHMIPIEQNVMFMYGGKRAFKSDIALADSNFFKVFQPEFLAGSADSALRKPRSIVLTQSFAKEFFEDGPCLGKFISTSNYDYEVTGIIEDLPENTHHYYEAIISYPRTRFDKEELQRTLWNIQCFTFLRVDEPEEAARIESDFDAFYQKYMARSGEAIGGSYFVELQRIDDIHFNVKDLYEMPGGKLAYLYGFAGIGLLILILASINYINMATARGLKRIREAAMRKVLGAEKSDIRLLLFAESVLLALLALFLGFVGAEVVTEVLPFNKVVGKDLHLSFSEFPFLLWLPLLLALMVGLLSGWYPAFTLARVAPLDAFSSKRGIHLKRSFSRKFLVGFQVAVSVAVVIIAFNMYRQMNFIKNKNLGFNTQNVLLVSAQDSVSLRNIEQIKTSLESSPYVQSCARGATETGSRVFRGVFGFKKSSNEYEKIVTDFLSVGEGYFETMGIPLVAGRGFTLRDQDDTAHQYTIVNQKLVEMMGWSDPIGQEVRMNYNEEGEVTQVAEVIGVASNFNANSLHAEIEPLMILLGTSYSNVMHVRIKDRNLYAAIDDIERRWVSIAPDAPFQFTFLDKKLQDLYEEEMRQSRLILYLTILAIMISFFGFIGLASFTTNLRTREIGIRKVLGANPWQTVNLIFRELLVVILVAVIAAVPLALFLSLLWLDNFAYRAPLEPHVVIFTAFIALLIGYGIVALHSFNISKSKTIESLHNP